jgi:hypothetical protein
MRELLHIMINVTTAVRIQIEDGSNTNDSSGTVTRTL